MNFDLRLPLGVMFAIYGLMLTLFGFATNGQEMYQTHSLGINVNLGWGIVLLVFGLVMLGLALKRKKP
jgi:hypothetical protein